MVISCTTEPSSLQFLLPDVDIATDAMPSHLGLHLQASGLPLSVSGSWSCSMCKAHVALQELQAVAMMLHRLAFHISGKVAALPLITTLQKLIYVIKVVRYLLFFPD